MTAFPFFVDTGSILYKLVSIGPDIITRRKTPHSIRCVENDQPAPHVSLVWRLPRLELAPALRRSRKREAVSDVIDSVIVSTASAPASKG